MLPPTDWAAAARSGVRRDSNSHELKIASPADTGRVDALYHTLGAASFGAEDRDIRNVLSGRGGQRRLHLREESNEGAEWLDQMGVIGEELLSAADDENSPGPDYSHVCSQWP